MPPRLTENDIRDRQDLDITYHIEAFYRYQITDNISIKPGFFVLVNPEHNDENDTIVVGLIKMLFNF